MHRRRMVELGRRYLGGHFRWTNLNCWRFEDGHVKHPHFYPTGKYSIKSTKCVMMITYGSQYFQMNFQIWEPTFKSSQRSLSISQTLWPLEEVFSPHNYQFLWFLFTLRSMIFNKTGRWMIYHNPYYFQDAWSIGNDTFYDYYWQDGSLTIPGIIAAW